MSQPDRLNQFVERIIDPKEDRDLPLWWKVLERTTTISGKNLVLLSSELKLADIPRGHGHCINCGHETQKEFVEWKIESESLVVEAYNMPGYGCTACPVKVADRKTVVGFDRAAIKEFRAIGDLERVQKLEYSIQQLESNINPR